MQKRIVVTGMGLVTPIGIGVDVVWNNLLSNKCGIKKLNEKEYERIPCKIAGYINDEELKYKFNKSQSRFIQFALIAAEEAIKSANLADISDDEKQNIGVSVGSGMGSFQDIINNLKLLEKENGYHKISPYFVPKILVNLAAGQISMKYGLMGPNNCCTTACATGLHSICDGFISFHLLIQCNEADIMICGSTEAVITPLSIAGFCRSKSITIHSNDNPELSSCPFDKHRNGFVMGEGCGILVLEEYKHAIKRNANIYCEIKGIGVSSDAYHITAPRPDSKGILLSMNKALKMANITMNEIDYVNAHATSTVLGDEIELKGIDELVKKTNKNNKKVFISSLKGNIGHLLGAAGSVETIVSILSLKNDILLPTYNLRETNISHHYIELIKGNFINHKCKYCLKNSFGFGGTNSSIVFSKI